VTLADVPGARWCPEPTAAAAQYATRARVAVGDRLAVYDLGGGTFDVCVLEQTATGFRVLGVPEGVEHLGGVDFDAALFAHVVRGLGARIPALDPSDPAATTALNRLRRDCVEAKEALSSDVDTAVPVNLPGLVTSVRVTRGELETLIRPPLEETVLTMRRALRAAEVEPSQLAGIILVGGSSRIPLVGELLEAAFHVPTALDIHPKHDVALGAVQLARQTAPASAPAVPPPPPAPPDDRAAPPVEPDPAAVRRRLRWPLPVAVAVLAAAAVVGVLVWTGRPDAGPLAPAALPALPQSVPLTGTELVVPMRVDGNWDLYLAETSRPAPVRPLTTDPALDVWPVLSPDRRSVVYVHRLSSAGQGEALRVMAADGSGDRALFPTPAECAGRLRAPAWDPADPSWLVLPCSDAAGRSRLLRMRTDGTGLAVVPVPDVALVDDPTLSADGSQVAYTAGAATGPEGGSLYVTRLADGTIRRLTTPAGEADDGDPAWSPDGSTIAFRRRVPNGTADGNLDLWTIPADGSGPPTSLAGGSKAVDQDPSWAPSGQQLAYRSTASTSSYPGDRQLRVWLMDADGGNRHLLWTAKGAGEQTIPSWTRH
jgi:molecular chaperone DnaK